MDYSDILQEIDCNNSDVSETEDRQQFEPIDSGDALAEHINDENSNENSDENHFRGENAMSVDIIAELFNVLRENGALPQMDRPQPPRPQPPELFRPPSKDSEKINYILTKIKNLNQECHVCYEPLDDNPRETVTCLNCFNGTNKSCFIPWAQKCLDSKSYPTCPICKCGFSDLEFALNGIKIQ